ncbi:MAG: hypothetical protein IH615_00725 [Devosia sp.]|nr:hypothetical protein [Devosia sp.]
MFARLVTIFAVLAITVLTTLTAAHAAGMSMSTASDRSAHVGEMMQVAGNSELSCDGEQPCGPDDAEMCEVVCAILSAFLTSPCGEAGHEYEPESYDVPSGTVHASLPPALNERPPKLRLL